MPPRLLAVILIAVICAAAVTVWLVTSVSGGQVPLVGIVGAVAAALALRLALRKRTP